MAELIVDACAPQRVVLFGSHAKGQADTASDIDLLVIGDFPVAPAALTAELRQLLSQWPVVVDLHILSTEEFVHATQAPHSFPGSVVPTGMAIYEKGRSPNEFVDRVELGW